MGTRNSLAAGIAAAFASVAIGAGWQVATRLGTTTSLQPIDLALLRYCIPAILLAPIWWRVRPIPASVDRRVLLAMLAGGGLPFGLLGMAGAQFAPVAHMGALLPGSMPLFVALLAAIVLGERVSARVPCWCAMTAPGAAICCFSPPPLCGRSTPSPFAAAA